MSDAWRPTGFAVGPEGAPDRYCLGPAVGSGAEGILYRASLTTTSGLEFEVAIKMLQPRFLSRVDEWAERWSEQVEVLRSLQVPGVVTVRDGFTGALPHLTGDEGQGRTLYLVMNWVDGDPLDEWVRRNPERDPLEDLRMLLPVAAALDLMHSGGPTGGIPVVHRDVKPANILVADGSTVLVDFGLTRGLPEGQRLSGVTGTPGYLAPECRHDGVYTAASDRYAFGAVVFFVLTGAELPVDIAPADLEAAVRDAPILADRPELAARVLAMLDPDPEQRPLSLANWIGQLRQSSLPELPGVLAPVAGSRRAAELVSASPRRLGTRAPRAPRPPGPTDRTGGRPGRRWTSARLGTTRRRIAAGLASAVVVATAVAFGAATGTQANTHSAARYAFTPQVFDGGLVADRIWTLSGTNGNQLQGTVTLTDWIKRPMRLVYAEVIPKAVARTLTALEVVPAPDLIIRADPIVGYSVDLKSQESRTLTYTVDIGKTSGSWLARLALLAHQQTLDEAAYLKSTGQKAPATLAQLTVTPSTLRLAANQSEALTVKGRMSDGTPAPPAALAGIVWSSSAPAIATVDNGTVDALNGGESQITAQAGPLVAAASVVVAGTPAPSTKAAATAKLGSSTYQLLRTVGTTSTNPTSVAAGVNNASSSETGRRVPPTTTTTTAPNPPPVGGGPTTTVAPTAPTTTTTTVPATVFDPPPTTPPDTDPPTTGPPDTDSTTTDPPTTDPPTTTVTSAAVTTTIPVSNTTPLACTTTVDCGGIDGSFDVGEVFSSVTGVCVTVNFSPGLASGWEVEVDVNGSDLGGWYNNGGIVDGVVQPATAPADQTTICTDPTQAAANAPLFQSLLAGTGMATTVDNSLLAGAGDAQIGSPTDTPFGIASESITITGTPVTS